MKNKKEILKYCTILIVFVLTFFAIIAFAGCLNYGATSHEGIYYVAGFFGAFLEAFGIIGVWSYLKEKQGKIDEK